MTSARRATTSDLRPTTRQEVGAESWDAVAHSSDEAWFWHLDAFARAFGTWRDTVDHSFALTDSGGAVAAIMPLHATAFGRLRGRLRFNRFFSLGGVAAAPEIGAKRVNDVRQLAIDVARSIAEGDSGVWLDAALPPLAPAFRGERCPRVNPLIEHGLANTLTQTWIVDLAAGRDAAWDGMRQRGRRMVRKAEKEELTVRPAAGPADLDAYYSLHVENYERTGVRPHPRAYFEQIWSDFIPAGLAYVLFAEHDGEVVAARNFAVFKESALYWTGAASDAGLELNASALLQWRAMESLIERDVRWMESGEAFPGSTDAKERGLGQFKGSFGGELYPQYRGRIEIDRPSFQALEAMATLRRAIGRRRS